MNKNRFRSRRLRAGALLAIGLLCGTALQAQDNAALQALRDADQADRRVGVNAIDWSIVAPRDEQRRAAVVELVRTGQLRTATDYANAALIYQHGATADEIRTAPALATLALTLEPQHASARWLSLAAWDRLLMREGRPQWWGTQFHKNAQGRWELYPVDEDAVTDTRRIEMGLPTLAAARERGERMNRR